MIEFDSEGYDSIDCLKESTLATRKRKISVKSSSGQVNICRWGHQDDATILGLVVVILKTHFSTKKILQDKS